tara:strand:+ start:157 stop:720 length:564 start_codon:yes stop_codon:yes gene_type:complete
MNELNNKLAQVQTKLKAKKSCYNSFGKYYFRKSEDILEAIKPFLLELDVSVTIHEEIVVTEPVPILKTTANFTDGESIIQATAVVGVDLNQKGMQTAQQFGAASTYGKKYALGNLFLIDDTEDADASNTHGKGSAAIKVITKPKPKITAEQFNKAKEYLQNGGKLEAIKTKYQLTKAQESGLEGHEG